MLHRIRSFARAASLQSVLHGRQVCLGLSCSPPRLAGPVHIGARNRSSTSGDALADVAGHLVRMLEKAHDDLKAKTDEVLRLTAIDAAAKMQKLTSLRMKGLLGARASLEHLFERYVEELGLKHLAPAEAWAAIVRDSMIGPAILACVRPQLHSVGLDDRKAVTNLESEIGVKLQAIFKAFDHIHDKRFPADCISPGDAIKIVVGAPLSLPQCKLLKCLFDAAQYPSVILHDMVDTK